MCSAACWSAAACCASRGGPGRLRPPHIPGVSRGQGGRRQRRDRPAGRERPRRPVAGGRGHGGRSRPARPVRRAAPRAAETRTPSRIHGPRGPLAVACMQTARRLDPQLRADIERLAERLVPPATNEAAEALAGAGEMLLDLLRAKPPQNPGRSGRIHQGRVQNRRSAALRLIGDILARHAERKPSPGGQRGNNAWRYFKPDLYVQEVLARSWPPEKELRVPDPAFAEVLHMFPGLQAVRCELRNDRRRRLQFVSAIDAEIRGCEASPSQDAAEIWT